MVVVFPEFMAVPITAIVRGRSRGGGAGRRAKSATFSGRPLLVPDQPDRGDVSRGADVEAAGEHRRGDATGSHQLSPPQVGGDVRLVLIGRVTVGVGDQDLVADMQRGPTPVGLLDLAVLAQPGDRGQNQVTRPRPDHAPDQRVHGRPRHPPGGESGLGSIALTRVERPDRYPSTLASRRSR